MSDSPPLAKGACADAIEHLERCSPADDANRWIGAWLLLRKIRTTAALASGASVTTGLLAALAFLPYRSDHPLYAGVEEVVKHNVVEGAGHFAVVGTAAFTFFGVYYGVALLRLGRDVAIPEPLHIFRIRSAMLPFDAIARAHLLRWSKSPYAS